MSIENRYDNKRAQEWTDKANKYQLSNDAKIYIHNLAFSGAKDDVIELFFHQVSEECYRWMYELGKNGYPASSIVVLMDPKFNGEQIYNLQSSIRSLPIGIVRKIANPEMRAEMMSVCALFAGSKGKTFQDLFELCVMFHENISQELARKVFNYAWNGISGDMCKVMILSGLSSHSIFVFSHHFDLAMESLKPSFVAVILEAYKNNGNNVDIFRFAHSALKDDPYAKLEDFKMNLTLKILSQ